MRVGLVFCEWGFRAWSCGFRGFNNRLSHEGFLGHGCPTIKAISITLCERAAKGHWYRQILSELSLCYDISDISPRHYAAQPFLM